MLKEKKEENVKMDKVDVDMDMKRIRTWADTLWEKTRNPMNKPEGLRLMRPPLLNKILHLETLLTKTGTVDNKHSESQTNEEYLYVHDCPQRLPIGLEKPDRFVYQCYPKQPPFFDYSWLPKKEDLFALLDGHLCATRLYYLDKYKHDCEQFQKKDKIWDQHCIYEQRRQEVEDDFQTKLDAYNAQSAVRNKMPESFFEAEDDRYLNELRTKTFSEVVSFRHEYLRRSSEYKVNALEWAEWDEFCANRFVSFLPLNQNKIKQYYCTPNCLATKEKKKWIGVDPSRLMV